MGAQKLDNTQKPFYFARPTNVYKEMYDMNGRATRAKYGLGILPSLVLSFIVVALVASTMAAFESSVMTAPDAHAADEPTQLQQALHMLLGVEAAHAADPNLTIRDGVGYSARYVSQSDPDPIVMEAGETKLVTVRFKNTGSKAWVADSGRYISAYTMEPRERDSVFFGAGWVSPSQIGKMAGTIAPGEIGTLGVYLHAPDTVGEYTEEFHLAAENYSWVEKGYFFLKVNVVPATAKPTPAPPEPEPESESDDEVVGEEEETTVINAKRIIQSKKSISAAGGERIKLVIAYQNLGEEPWESYAWTAGAPTALAASQKLTFADASWKGSHTIAFGKKSVLPYESLKKTIYLRTPAKKGEYVAQLSLAIDGESVDTLSIPVSVTSNAPSKYKPPVFDEDDEPIEVDELEVPRLKEEPRIKVGLWKPEGNVQFISYEDEYNVYAGDEFVGTLPKKKFGFLSYEDGEYTIKNKAVNITTSKPIRLEPANDPHAIFVLHNYKREGKWKGPYNFNRYSGAMEYRKGEFSDDVWVVNDTLLHDYAKGIGENSDGSPMEYLKSQSVAQVSYAYAIKQSDKHGIFDVVATTGDQLFLGSRIEDLMPNFVKAVDSVRGYMVTYNGEPVITPYYAHSDGHTRGWHQVWGGSKKPWLISVKAHYDAGRKMFGHGVGMSQIDASLRAKNEGLEWRELLEYYYTDTQAQKMYL